MGDPSTRDRKEASDSGPARGASNCVKEAPAPSRGRTSVSGVCATHLPQVWWPGCLQGPP